MKKLPKSQIEFEHTIPQADWEKHLDAAASEAGQEIKMPGFRPGKAPRHLVEQKVGKEIIQNGAAERAIQKHYADFVVREKIEVVGSPKIELLELEKGKDLRYKATVAVMPEVEIDEKYKKDIKKINEQFKDKSTAVKDEDLKLELEKLANSRVKLVTVRREARKNDSVEVDFEVLVSGVPIEGGTSKNHPIVIGRGVFIPGFEEKLVGMKEGEKKEFELNFPKEYHKKDLAGKLATFKVKVNLVQERQTPEINDDFAASLGKFENLEALKKNLREGMEEENKRKLNDEKRAKYMEAIIEKTKGELPDILTEEEVKRMFLEFEQQLAPMGMNMDQYLAQLKKDRKELEKDWKPQADKRVRGALALTKIAKTQEIKVESKEVEAEMNKTLQHYKGVENAKKNINMERLYSYSKGVLENEKVFEYLGKI